MIREQLLHAHPDYTINISFDEKAIEADADFSINGNEYLMNIALKNLMENNCKYSANHTSNILISTQEGYICITLSDTGTGMTPEEQRSMFQLFYRGSSLNQDTERRSAWRYQMNDGKCNILNFGYNSINSGMLLYR